MDAHPPQTGKHSEIFLLLTIVTWVVSPCHMICECNYNKSYDTCINMILTLVMFCMYFNALHAAGWHSKVFCVVENFWFWRLYEGYGRPPSFIFDQKGDHSFADLWVLPLFLFPCENRVLKMKSCSHPPFTVRRQSEKSTIIGFLTCVPVAGVIVQVNHW